MVQDTPAAPDNVEKSMIGQLKMQNQELISERMTLVQMINQLEAQV